MIGFARLAEVVARAASRLEPRHWIAVGASVALHLGVILGWQPEPPPEPQPISFEITFEPPSAKPLPAKKVKTVAKKTPSKKIAQKAKPLAAKKKVKDRIQREAHLLDASWRAENKAAKDAPALALPEATAFGIQAANPELASASVTPQLKRAAVASASAAKPAAPSTSENAPDLIEPNAASVGSQQRQPGETGLALAHSTTLTASQSANPATGSAGAQANTAAASLAGAAGGASGQGGSQGGLSLAAASQAALNAASGAGMQTAAAASASAQTVPNGPEPQGVRLAVSGVLSTAAALPAGNGSLAAAPQTAALAQGAAQSISGKTSGLAAAGGQLSGNPLAGGPPALPGGRNAPAAGSGSAQASHSEAGSSRGGRGLETPGRLGVAAQAPGALLGSARVTSAPERSGQGGETVALAPGEPGSGPNFAVTLQPVVASLANPYLSGRSGQSGAGGSGESAAVHSRATSRAPVDAAKGGGALPFSGAGAGNGVAIASGRNVPLNTLGIAGGLSAAPGQAASAAVLNAARDAGRAPVVLQATQAVAVKVVRPDSEIQRLDVLAPSNYCPLPLPGHNQPDNRAPQPNRQLAEQPAYALDNPSISYPVLANIRGVEGRVTVRVEVLSDGRPGKMWLKQSSGSDILDRDAQAQLKQWRFVPARKNGQPVSAWINVPVLYRLSQARP